MLPSGVLQGDNDLYFAPVYATYTTGSNEVYGYHTLAVYHDGNSLMGGIHSVLHVTCRSAILHAKLCGVYADF